MLCSGNTSGTGGHTVQRQAQPRAFGAASMLRQCAAVYILISPEPLLRKDHPLAGQMVKPVCCCVLHAAWYSALQRVAVCCSVHTQHGWQYGGAGVRPRTDPPWHRPLLDIGEQSCT